MFLNDEGLSVPSVCLDCTVSDQYRKGEWCQPGRLVGLSKQGICPLSEGLATPLAFAVIVDDYVDTTIGNILISLLFLIIR